MPYRFETEKKKIDKKDDKRVKLDDSDKRLIKELYKTGEYSQRKLARDFKVSRRLIQFILDPKKLEQNLAARKARGGSKQYYEKEKNTEYIKKHRQYKRSLDLDDKLI